MEVQDNKAQRDQVVLRVQLETVEHLETQAAQVDQEPTEQQVPLGYLVPSEVLDLQDLKEPLGILVYLDKEFLDHLVSQVLQETEDRLALLANKVQVVK